MHNRRRLKAFKVKPDLEGYTVGHDITLNKFEGLSKMDLVGRMEYVKLNRVEMIN